MDKCKDCKFFTPNSDNSNRGECFDLFTGIHKVENEMDVEQCPIKNFQPKERWTKFKNILNNTAGLEEKARSLAPLIIEGSNRTMITLTGFMEEKTEIGREQQANIFIVLLLDILHAARNIAQSILKDDKEEDYMKSDIFINHLLDKTSELAGLKELRSPILELGFKDVYAEFEKNNKSEIHFIRRGDVAYAVGSLVKHLREKANLRISESNELVLNLFLTTVVVSGLNIEELLKE